MSCYFPLTAYYSKEFGKSGKRGVTFDRGASFSGVPMKLPCGQCIGCRLDHSLQWAVRCMHEKQLHDESAFVTLTYDDDHLPEGGSLSVRHHQLFMKKFRKKFGKRIRFYMCGEYGELTKRPHYHYLFFNRDLPDRKYFKTARNGEKYYTSEVLRDLWPEGNNIIGNVTLESCAYVARYITEKINGAMAEAHYRVVTGEGVVIDRTREFTCGSRRPGIASDWYAKFGKHSHVSGDFVVLNGKRCRVPRFYDNRYELTEPDDLARLKKRRLSKARKHRLNNTVDRRRVREVVALKRAKMFSRGVDK